MVRKGKRARVTYCKRAECSRPVSVYPKLPQKGKMQDGLEKARKVIAVKTVNPAWRAVRQEENIQPLSVEIIPTKPAAEGKTTSCTKTTPKMQNVLVHKVKKDITLQTLFSRRQSEDSR